MNGDDFRDAMLLHISFHKRKKVLITFLVGGLFVLAILLYFFGTGLGFLLLLATTAYIMRDSIMSNLFLPETSRRLYSEQKLLHAPQHIAFSDGGISISSEYGNKNISWSQVQKWRENEQFVLIYQTDDQFVVLPKRDLAEKLPALIVLLEQNRIPAI